MASLHKITEALASVRGMPVATVESYARPLRQHGVIPPSKRGRGASTIEPRDAAHLLLAVMRGSPKDAAHHAQEAGGLTVSAGTTFDPISHGFVHLLGWTEASTLAEAIGSIVMMQISGDLEAHLDRDRKNDDIFVLGIEVDRYWPSAQMTFQWTDNAIKNVYNAAKDKFSDFDDPNEPYSETQKYYRIRRSNRITFADPLHYKRRAAYGVDQEENRRMTREWSEKRRRLEQYDLFGNEKVTGRTIKAIADAFAK